MIRYIYKTSGEAHGGQTWSVEGTITLDQGDFANGFDRAMRDTFMQLTRGKAVYGKPGLGCSGPYTVTHFEMTWVGEAADAG